MDTWRGDSISRGTSVLPVLSTPTLTSPSFFPSFFPSFLSFFGHQLLARATSIGNPPSISDTVGSACCTPGSAPRGERGRVPARGSVWLSRV